MTVVLFLIGIYVVNLIVLPWIYLCFEEWSANAHRKP